MSRHFLGVDGGGSKTAFVVLEDAGRTEAEVVGPSCYYFATGIGLVEQVLSEGLARVGAAAGITVAELDHAFFGLPGYGEVAEDAPKLRAIVRDLLGHDRFSCGNDMLGGWAGALAGRDGINVVAGTGSIVYGERDGRAHRSGGWGEVFGDEGSGYWVAVRSLNAFSRMSDGRLPRGPLHELIAERAGIAADLDLVGVVFERWGARRAEIAALSKVVTEAAESGDSVAAGILRTAGRELVALVEACRNGIGYRDGEQVDVSYSGGMFSAPSFRAAFADALAAAGSEYRLCAPLYGPGVGSALYAMKLGGAALPLPPPASARSLNGEEHDV